MIYNLIITKKKKKNKYLIPGGEWCYEREWRFWLCIIVWACPCRWWWRRAGYGSSMAVVKLWVMAESGLVVSMEDECGSHDASVFTWWWSERWWQRLGLWALTSDNKVKERWDGGSDCMNRDEGVWRRRWYLQ